MGKGEEIDNNAGRHKFLKSDYHDLSANTYPALVSIGCPRPLGGVFLSAIHS